MGRAGAALVLANTRYWPTVRPHVQRELRRWRERARLIGDAELQALALDKLRAESFNAEVAATLATLVHRRRRTEVIKAVVASEVIFDYLDGLTELPASEPLSANRSAYQALIDAVAPHPPATRDYYRGRPAADGGYLQELVETVRAVLPRLPGAGAVFDVAASAATRCAEVQSRAHAVECKGTGQLERWARPEARAVALTWQEFIAGAASSVLTMHALIAAAADARTTAEQARAIDETYFALASLCTLLDSVVDYEQDLAAGQLGYIRYHSDVDRLARTLTATARRAAAQTRSLPHGAHHLVTLLGVVAYYTSTPEASASEPARHVTRRLQRELAPLIWPTWALMRAWRLGKSVGVARVGRLEPLRGSGEGSRRP